MGGVRRVGIVGMGHVGAHVANALMLQGVVDELVLCDIDGAKLSSETQDLADAISFCPHSVVISSCGDSYEELAGCDVVVNAAGSIELALKSRDGELAYTTQACRTFASRIVSAGFDGVWVSVANPCDVVATEFWHLTGYDPRRVIGTGTALDSARLRHEISLELGVDQGSVSALMLGEHGNAQFAAWSQASVGGVSLAGLASRQLDLAAIEGRARHGGYVTISGKRCTEYAIAGVASRLCQAILANEHAVIPCSTLLTGEFGEEGVFASLPCVVGSAGVERVIEPPLDANERSSFSAAVGHIRDNISQLPWWDE